MRLKSRLSRDFCGGGGLGENFGGWWPAKLAA